MQANVQTSKIEINVQVCVPALLLGVFKVCATLAVPCAAAAQAAVPGLPTYPWHYVANFTLIGIFFTNNKRQVGTSLYHVSAISKVII